MSRGTRAILRMDALRHNLGVVRKLAPASRVMAVVKANAYGHGIERTVEALSGADGFAVATLCEAERVRQVDGRSPVLLLEGVTTAAELAAAREFRLDLVVHSELQLQLLESAGPGGPPLGAWLKVDTGMNRLGFRQSQAAAAMARLRAAGGVRRDIVLMSHLARADEPGSPATRDQLRRFEELCRGIPAEARSLANSAGVFAWPGSHHDWVRTGIALFGESPLADRSVTDLGLAPCMTVESTLIAINRCRRGDAVGYGGAFTCPEDMPVGVVAIGYGDGYPRRAGNGTPVLVGGRRCPLAGRVSMDMLTVDLRGVPEVRLGDRVTLWGEGLPVAEIAAAAQTIPYELMCGITARVRTEAV